MFFVILTNKNNYSTFCFTYICTELKLTNAMTKKSLFFLAILYQLMLYANNKTTKSIYIDSAISELSVSAENSDLNTYHLFSHGRSGELFIDDQWLNVAEIAEKFKTELQGKKELYIYGCNFGEGKKGREATEYLEKILNISVSASNNVTGIDGDWILEIGDGKNALKKISYKGNLQLDNIHYLNPVVYSVYSLASTIGEEYIYLSTPETANITVQMNYPSGAGAPRVSVTNLTSNSVSYVTSGSLTFNNANPIRLQFVNASNAVIGPGNTPTTIPYNKAGTILDASTAGLIFKSINKFYVNYRGRSTPQAGSVMTKGNAALGKEFRWGGSPVEYATTVAEVGNALSIMATKDNTTVIISNIKPGTKFRDGPAGTTTLNGPSITRILNKGQSFILYAPVEFNMGSSSQNTGWLGAKVTSNEDVSVIVGGLLQQGGVANNRDIGLDQLVPVNQLGLEHIVMKGNGTSTDEKIIVVAAVDNTVVYLNNTTAPFATLSLAGQYVLIPGSNFNASNNIFVRVTQPAYVFHKIYGSTANQTNSLMFIPPVNCFGQKEVNLIPDVSKIGSTSYTGTQLVVLAAAGTANIPVATLGGTPLTATAGTVTGNSNWLSYRYAISGSGNVKVSSNSAIQAQVFGASSDAGFGGYYSGFGTTPTASVSISTPYGSPCIGRSILTVTTSEAGTYQWYKDDVAISGATASTYELIGAANATSARYYVIVTYPGGCTIRSNELTSEVCPCPKPGATGTPDSFTDLGISTRDIRSTPNWPKDIPNGFITMESNNKGFVITRIESPETVIPASVATAGMLVYDTLQDCLKLFNGTSWKCIKQTCND